MPYTYNGTEYDDDRPRPLYPPRPYKRAAPMPGNERLHAAAAEMYPNDSRLHTYHPSPAGEQYLTDANGRRMRTTTAQRFDQIARLIPTGATRAQILKDVGWDELAFHRACQRHGMTKLWDAMPQSAKKRQSPGRPKGPAGPHTSTINRLEDLVDLLQDPRCSKEEALQRAGWTGFEAFSRAAYRAGRKHLIRMYHEHGQRVDPIHLVHAGRMASRAANIYGRRG